MSKKARTYLDAHVDKRGAKSRDMGVIHVASSIPLRRVASDPAAGQYTFDEKSGTYTFSEADVPITLTIHFLAV